MNIEQIREVLETIGYPVQGESLQVILDDLHDHYSAQVVGSSIRHLGDADPLYVKAGQVAFMVDNEHDLVAACIRIRSSLKQREAAQPVTMQAPKRSRFLPDIVRAVEYEIEIAERVKRPLGMVTTGYEIKYDPESRTQSRKSAQILDDLLADDAQRNKKAVDALKAVLIL